MVSESKTWFCGPWSKLLEDDSAGVIRRRLFGLQIANDDRFDIDGF